jgi:DNA helicase-2/ATP-dependent DNA helicase PcrA
LQLSYAVTRDFRGVRRRTIPSSFLMEMPREELELVDAATAFIADQEQAKRDAWEEPESMEDWIAAGEADDSDLSDATEWHLEDVSVDSLGDTKTAFSIAAAAITTATALTRDAAEPAAPALPRVSPDVFQQGMTVMHPEYGPGKIVALSGSGKNRRATVQFATVGEKKIILAHSHLRPTR